MQSYMLKDSKSKSLIYDWFRTSMSSYAADSGLNWNDEDSLCAEFFKSISGLLSTPAGDLIIRSYKTRGRGPGAAERKLGADGIALVQINTPSTQLSGFFLFQAKKAIAISSSLRGASDECIKMLDHTAASYLLVLLPTEVKMAGAMAVKSYVSGTDPHLTDIPFVNFPRFIVEHILQGVMMEPLDKAMELLTPELKKEISHVISIVGGNDQQIEEAMMKVDSYIRELELDIYE
jgi:hypothetical protein